MLLMFKYIDTFWMEGKYVPEAKRFYCFCCSCLGWKWSILANLIFWQMDLPEKVWKQGQWDGVHTRHEIQAQNILFSLYTTLKSNNPSSWASWLLFSCNTFIKDSETLQFGDHFFKILLKESFKNDLLGIWSLETEFTIYKCNLPIRN